MTVNIKKSDIEKALLFNDGLEKHIIYLFSDGSSASAPATIETIANTASSDIPLIAVRGLDGKN